MTKPTPDATARELDAAIVVEFPLRGEWTPAHSPATKIPSHGTDQLAQRYAFDLLRLDDRNRYHAAGTARTILVGVPTRECHGWGETVHAVLDGEVVVAHDGEPERRWLHPIRELLLVVVHGLTFRPTDRMIAKLVGNHVIVRSGDVHAVFAHLAPGSVAVRPGEEVRAGDVLGRLGSSGNSTAPHLHFQLMDGPDARTARPLPAAFRALERRRDDGTWERVANVVPANGERVQWAA